MLIAEQKKAENIAEYIIYMFQMEDMMRAFNFDKEKIKEHIILPQTPPDDKKSLQKNEQWFYDIVDEMKSRELEKSGHIYAVTEVLNEFLYLHNTFIDVTKSKNYIAKYEEAEKVIEDFQKKSNLNEIHPVQVALEALYMKLLLRLKKQAITDETEKAFEPMRKMLQHLTKAYHQMKKGDMSMFEKQ
jgi:RecG-like helicase